MRIGIGAGLGPVRVGASSRVSGSGFLGFVIPCVIIGGILAVIITWPYMLGTWLAVLLGAAENSTTSSVVGWILEALYIFVLSFGAISALVTGSSDLSGQRASRG